MVIKIAGIVVGLPRAILNLYELAKTGAWGPFTPIALIFLIALMIAVVAFIVFVEGGQRRIPVQYAKRVVGRKVMLKCPLLLCDAVGADSGSLIKYWSSTPVHPWGYSSAGRARRSQRRGRRFEPD